MNFFLITKCDSPERWQASFQDPATPIVEGIINLHHDIVLYETIIFGLVSWIFLRTIYLFADSKTNTYRFPVNHNSVLEFVWTLIPALILLVIAIPTFALLYGMDDIIAPEITIKVLGHQWYWRYEYADYQFANKTCMTIESYMVRDGDLEWGQLRLLEVDNRLVLPINTNIRLLITAADVLHSWAVPSLGIKLDACPGRINQTALYINRAGVFYGQCSEICGVNHGFMPIVVEAVSVDNFNDHVESMYKQELIENK
jgi:cytochrome c oxidase subunit 2